MNRLVFLAILVLSIFASSAAHGGAVYQYRYTFADGSIVNGEFTGNASGNLISDLSNISVFFNGVAFNGSGSLYAASLDSNYIWQSGTGVASFDGLQNNFLFSDTDYSIDKTYTNYFYDAYPITHDAYMYASRGESWDDLSSDSYIGGNWSVTTATDVPEPAPVLLLGFACICLVLVHRRNS
jgi:hypothetical protein